MRVPLQQGTPVDEPRIASWVGRFQGYRVLVDRPQIEHWLAQFQDDHRDLAARLLDAVDFINPAQIEQALRAALGHLPGWHRDDNNRTGRWRFVALGGTGKSGERMMHHFRVATDMTWDQYSELFIHKSELVMANLGPQDSVVFVDDFAGSGRQARDAWQQNLAELLASGPAAYLLLVAATARAIERISSETKLKPEPHITLAEDQNFFSPACTTFTTDDKDALLEYCSRADPQQPRGYGDCGLVLVFAHRCPNNSIPVFHASRRRFKGLFPRN